MYSKKKFILIKQKIYTLFIDIFLFSYKNGVFGDKFGNLFEIMGKRMNFTHKGIPSKDGQYGTRVSLINLIYFISLGANLIKLPLTS